MLVKFAEFKPPVDKYAVAFGFAADVHERDSNQHK
jgi:hypothetical protein